MRENTVIKMSVQRMVCTGCGSEANATCDCGVSYVPKAVRARQMREADPNRSLGSIAEELGVARQSVSDALKVAGHLPPAQVVGRDGKTYPAKLRMVDDVDDDADADADHEEGMRVIAARGFLNRATEAKEIATVGKLQPSDVTEAMIKAADDAAAAWSTTARNLRGMISHG